MKLDLSSVGSDDFFLEEFCDIFFGRRYEVLNYNRIIGFSLY